MLAEPAMVMQHPNLQLVLLMMVQELESQDGFWPSRQSQVFGNLPAKARLYCEIPAIVAECILAALGLNSYSGSPSVCSDVQGFSQAARHTIHNASNTLPHCNAC